MKLDDLIRSMSPAVYEKLRLAVETGKWLDGTALTEEQKATCMQAVRVYQSKISQTDEHFTMGSNGEIIMKSRETLQNQFSNQPSIALFKQHDI